MTDSTLVPLDRYCDCYGAHVIRGLLETNDIQCFVFDGLHAQNVWYMQHIMGVRIMVRQSDLEAARAVIEHAQLTPLDLPEGEQPPQTVAESMSVADKIIAVIGTIAAGAPFIPRPKKNKK